MYQAIQCQYVGPHNANRDISQSVLTWPERGDIGAAIRCIRPFSVSMLARTMRIEISASRYSPGLREATLGLRSDVSGHSVSVCWPVQCECRSLNTCVPVKRFHCLHQSNRSVVHRNTNMNKLRKHTHQPL